MNGRQPQYNRNGPQRRAGSVSSDRYDDFDEFDDIEPEYDDGFDDIDSEYDSRPAHRSGSRNGGYPDSRKEAPHKGGEAKTPNKGGSTEIIIAVVLLNLIVIGALLIYRNYAFIGTFPGNMVIETVNTTQLDLRESTIDNFSGIEKLSALESLDIRGLDVSIDEYNDLVTMVPPRCDIMWSVPVGSRSFDSDTTVVSLSDIGSAELDALPYLEQLESASISGCTEFDKLIELTKEMPDCRFEWTIPICGVDYPADTTDIALAADFDPAQLDYLRYLPKLRSVDATAFGDVNALIETSKLLPHCRISWNVPLADVTVNSLTDSVNLSRHTIGDLGAFSAALAKLPNLKYVDMCGCGLSNEQMASLCEQFPDKKLVWEVEFGDKNSSHWKVRTDATIFSTLNHAGGVPYTQRDYAPLFLYCKDLVALDLGHSKIDDISMITNLKELKFLILGDNRVRDISPLASLEKLEYIEMWLNNISDVSPLSSLEHLTDLDLANNYVSDLTPLYKIKSLKTLRLDTSLSTSKDIKNPFPARQLADIGTALPQCYVEHLTDDAYQQFKNNPRYLAMKMAFSNHEHVVYFRDWNDIKFDASFYK